ncbi:MAG: 2-oxoacid:acceptor oxidoreductase family protein [Chloroflexi bacterium]|nr:2-oxoacid:acceptor oxidoreductase family protein [Chloroflexota bacterium]
MQKIIISGEGGQGVRVIGHTLATLLTNLGYQVSLIYDYDSAVRGALSLAYVVFDKVPIANPVVEEADILLQLSNIARGIKAKKTVCETGLCTEEEIPFGQWGIAKFGKEVFGNMIALGRLMKLVGVEASEAELRKVLPLKYQEENLKAVLFGYHLREEDLGRGRHSTETKRTHFESREPGELVEGDP